MKTISIFAVCVFLKVSSAKEPQIYEKTEDSQVEYNTRVVRQPYQVKKNYRPPVYNYQQTIQQDPRQFRYAQQQRLDMQNILRKNRMIQNPEAPLRVSLEQNWKIIDPTVASSTIEQNYKLPDQKRNDSVWTRIAQLSTKKPVTSRKLNPSSYYEQLDEDKVKREDMNNIQINPEFLKIKRSDYDLNALNALVGQDPSNQLQGLKRLLESPQNNFVLPIIKNPHPITEQTEDIPNPNTHPNIDTSGMSLESLQSQLDEAAKAQLAKALADAQKEAEAHVEAQHKAIARAQEEAQKKALAQIALHNQQINAEVLQQPLALALKQEIVSTPQALPLKPTSQHLAYQNPVLQAITLPVSYKATPKPITLTIRQKPNANLYAPTHSHQNQNKEVVKTHDNNLKTISITKTHSVTQGHQSPNAYQQVLLETQQKKQKSYTGVNHVQDLVDNVGDHQYTARYAFGYKIRDVQKGNEFGHEEKRDGENAKGLYHVLLPDGRMQKVEYYADEGGYHAKVTYENMAHQ